MLPTKTTVMNIVWVLGTLTVINHIDALEPVKNLVMGDNSWF